MLYLTDTAIAACLTASNEMLYRRAGGAITTMFQTKFTILIHTDIHPYRKDYNPSPGLGEEDEGGERGSGLGGYDHGGRTWERCGYGGGGRYALDIAPFKKCPKCSFPGHIERDCKVTPCFRCMGFGHMAMDCKGIPCFRCRGFGHTAMDCKGILYCGGGGWNVSSSGSWVGQPPIQ